MTAAAALFRLLPLTTLLLTAAATRAADPVNADWIANVNALPLREGKRTPTEFLNLSTDPTGRIRLVAAFPDSLGDGRPCRVDLAGFTPPVFLQFARPDNPADPPKHLDLQAGPPNGPGVHVYLAPNIGLALAARYNLIGDVPVITNVEFSQPDVNANPFAPDAARTTLHLQTVVRDKPKTRLKLTAPTFAALYTAHPVEVGDYLRPIFQRLEQPHLLAPPPALAAQVFPDYKIDPAGQRRVAALVADLDHTEPAKRAAAAHALTDLDAAADASLTRVDPQSLTPEQQAALKSLTLRNDHLTKETISKLLADRDFLLDCLYGNDGQTPALALAHLKRLDSQVEFDPQTKARRAAIERLRTAR